MSLPIVAGVYPYRNTTAGLSLTEADCQSAGAVGAVYSLPRLLMRPGYEALFTQQTWLSQHKLTGPVVVDTTGLMLRKDGQGFYVCSDYDGSQLSYRFSELFSLFKMMAVDALLWPYEPNLVRLDPALQNVPWYFPSHTTPGFYRSQQFPESVLLASDLPSHALKVAAETAAVLSNTPLDDAINGRLYHASGVLDIRDTAVARVDAVLDEHCRCLACALPLSQAYLHHLYTHTPLLCHRFLGIHNLASISKLSTRNRQ